MSPISILVMWILIFAGIYILVKGKIEVSEKREITRPVSTFVGLVLVLIPAAQTFLPVLGRLTVMAGILCLTVMVAYMLSDEKKGVSKAKGKK